MAAPPQEVEEAYDLIQEVEWNKELSNTITLIGHLGCVCFGLWTKSTPEYSELHVAC